MATSLDKLKKGSYPSISLRTLSYGENTAKIGLVEPEEIGLD